MNNEVLAIILGGGQGTRLFPLTQHRSKPAVPIGGNYRLIDIPISNCLHADIRRIFVLTQFNSASLNRHIAQTYRMDLFSQGFVEILAAEQTPDNPNWFQGTADAVRQAARHFVRYDADYYLILAGDHLYRMDYARAGRRAHRSARRHHHRRAAGHGRRRVGDGHLPLRSQRPDRRVRGEAERASGSTEIGQSIPPGATLRRHTRRQAVRRLDGHLRVLARRAARRARAEDAAKDFGREIIPAALGRYQRATPTCSAATGPTSARSRRSTTRTSCSRSPARRSSSTIRDRPIYTHPRFLPGVAPQRLRGARRDHRRGLLPRSLPRSSSRSSASARTSSRGATIRRSVLLGADYYEADDARAGAAATPRLGIGRDVVLDRVIVDKNARIGDGAQLVNAQGSSRPTATATTSATASSSCRRTA